MPEKFEKEKSSAPAFCCRRKPDEKYPYVELQAASNFSFMRGASSPEELVTRSAELGYYGLAITDFNSLSGIVRAHGAAKNIQFPYYAASRLEVVWPENSISKFPVLAYPTGRESYGRLCRILTAGKRRAENNGCEIHLEDLIAQNKDLALIIAAPEEFLRNEETKLKQEKFMDFCAALNDSAGDRSLLSLALSRDCSPADGQRLRFVRKAAERFSIPLVVTGNVYYHEPTRRQLQDVLACIRNKCTVQNAGCLLLQNDERYLKSPREIYRIFREFQPALRRTVELASMLKGFSLDQLRYEYPDEICPVGMTPAQYLAQLVRQGAADRYPRGVPEKVTGLIEEELKLIAELGYEKYFLTCFDLVKFARAQRILCQGRGAAANSAVCYCLGITAVDPARIDLLFARFISRERNEPPDIDIDFEHERREEVIQYIYRRYGRERAGLTCEVITYRHRSAVRDVGKAMGLSRETVDKLAKSIHRWTACRLAAEDFAALGLDPDDFIIKTTIALSNQLLGFPRHLSQHVGGFIISERPLCETVPISNAAMPERTIIEWDKDDIEALGMLKIDVLALGMLSCVRKALGYVNTKRKERHERELEFHTIPAEDSATYDMICAADTIGVFQIESRAQMSMLPRLKPRCFYDLVIEVALVRPGPIQGKMVHPYLRRRNGLEKVSYPDRRVADILEKTMGVPIFQEQAMRLAIVLAKFTPGEAEQLRRAMAAWKRDKGVVASFSARIVKGMTENGYSREFAESCVNQIRGFSEYGFPESHAASFALIVYVSAWLKKHYPAEFAAALINSQPMGFYAPAQIVSDAGNHGIRVFPVDVNESGWDCRLENGGIRLGMRLIRGLGRAQAELVTDNVEKYGKAPGIRELWKRIRSRNSLFHRATLQLLARADAFQSLGLNSREALWQVRALSIDMRPVDLILKEADGVCAHLPVQGRQLAMFQDYRMTGLSLKGHPFEFIRSALDAGRGTAPSKESVFTALELKNLKKHYSGKHVSVAGLAIFRQRPGTANGVVFVTLEDETGITNLIIRPEVYEHRRRVITSSASLLATGTLERIGQVVYVAAERIESLDHLVLAVDDPDLPLRSYSY